MSIETKSKKSIQMKKVEGTKMCICLCPFRTSVIPRNKTGIVKADDTQSTDSLESGPI